MKNRKLTKSIEALVALAVLATTSTLYAQDIKEVPNTLTTTQGTYILDSKGMPDNETIKEIFNELDYQNAVQSYLWAYPQMVVAGQHNMNKFYGAKDSLDLLHLYKDVGIDGMLTPNSVVKYIVNFYNFEENGPMVLEMPGGMTVGLMMDYQMRWVADLGLVGRAGPNAEKVVFIGPNQNAPDEALANGWRVERVTTNVGFLAVRVLQPEKDVDLAEKVKVYPYSDRANPKANPIYKPKADDETFFIRPPAGMAYWEQLNEIIQQEKVQDTDRYFMSRLESLGMKKGQAFNPTKEQIATFKRAGAFAEKTAMVSSFVPRSEAAKYRDDSSWSHIVVLQPHHLTEHTNQFEERFDMFYEAYGISPAMKASVVGKGSTYLGAYRDDDGVWLDGSNNYQLRIEPNAPAAQFWSVTTYDMKTRANIQNGDDNRYEINSFTPGLVKNEDGAIDIYFGPEAPKGHESNWIKTVEGENWFSYFRLYAPTEAYFDRSYKLNNVKKIK